MPNRESLLAGRHAAQLEAAEITRAYNTFIGLDNTVPVRYQQGVRTVFRVPAADGGDCEIVFGEDIYPGGGVVDPNSSLSLQAAAAHELTHFYRWRDKTELDGDDLAEIDEALTSLEATLRFPRDLSAHDMRQLVADAVQRLQMFAQRNRRATAAIENL
jgi:hypothetical protein